MKKICLSVGLTQVNPEFYEGWIGECPGCDLDARRCNAYCIEHGFDSSILFMNETATQGAVEKFFRGVGSLLKPDDLLVFYCSGHGGQREDFNGDEIDCLDETLCLWDGQLGDDTINQYFSNLPRGVRIFYFTDTCNSGTNYRSRCDYNMVYFGGCGDGHSSYGGVDGGVFTNVCFDVLADARKPLNYREWFDRACFKMTGQVPALEVVGGFLDREAFC